AAVTIPTYMIPFLAFMKPVSYISPWGDRVQTMDQIRRPEIMNAESVWAAGYDGDTHTYYTTPSIIGSVRDGGIDMALPNFEGRVLYRSGTADDPHGTACAEVIMSALYGIAPKAYIRFNDWGDADTTVITNLNDRNGKFNSNSWGSEGDATGTYEGTTATRDQTLRANREILFLWASGNAEIDVSFHATGKNVLSVGGVNQGSNQLSFGDDSHGDGSGNYKMADNRVKPDMVAYYDRVSTEAYGPDGFGGTSAATPQVAGAAALVYELFYDDYFNTGASTIPRATTVKAMLIANAYQYPTTQISRERQGWGFPKLDDILYEPHGLIVNEGTTVNTGQTQTYTIATSGQLKVTLVWSDYQGTAGATGNVNDLDLEVYEHSTGRTYYGNNGMDTSIWTSYGTTTNPWRGSAPDAYRDGLNNVENVFLATAGGTYDVIVRGRNVPNGPQDYALVASGVPYTIASVRMDKQTYAGYEEATITVKDASGDVNDPLAVDYPVVRVTSNADPIGVDVVLTETDGWGFPAINTNTYTGKLRFNPTPVLPGATGDGKSYSNTADPTMHALIAVNVYGDDVTAQFTDTDPAPTRYPQFTSYVDSYAPKVSGVRVSNVGYTTFGMAWETDEPAMTTMYIEVVDDPTKFNNDDDYDLWDAYTPATLDDIRNGRSMSLYAESTDLSTEHELVIIDMLPGEDYYVWISSEDSAGNIRANTNGGEFYKISTWEQPFEILIWEEDPLWGAGGVGDWISIMYSGYRTRFMWRGYNGETTSYDWNAGKAWGKYGDEFVASTWGQWWTDMVAAQNTGVPNIVVYSSGGSGADMAVGGGTAISPYVRTDMSQAFYGIDDLWDNNLQQQTKRDRLADFYTAGGKLVVTGSGLTESSLDYGYTGWLSTYGRVTVGTAPASTQSKDETDYDVSYGLLA
ncbi:MAG: S8 family serine peptidase, partial [Candidatus Thermoplasmatota archaeon]|nr:S8 family serine peptidase [Candidatus Thermoplasmatota archaeon]